MLLQSYYIKRIQLLDSKVGSGVIVSKHRLKGLILISQVNQTKVVCLEVLCPGKLPEDSREEAHHFKNSALMNRFHSRANHQLRYATSSNTLA